MKLGEAIAKTDQMKPNGYTAEEKTRWLSELDGTLWDEALQWAEAGEKPELPYDYDRDLDRELAAADAYADLYIKYLFAQIDFHNGDFSRYNASAALYQAGYDSYTAHLRREKPPDRKGGFCSY